MKLSVFLERVANAQTETQLRSTFIDIAGRLIGAKAWGLDLLDGYSQVIATDLYGLPARFQDDYQKIGQAADTLSRRMIQHHIPVHNLSVQTQQSWQRSPLYQNFLRPYGIESGMLGPLVGNGRLIGGIYFFRGRDLSPFDDSDLISLSSLCLHLSVRLATLRTSALISTSSGAACLTKRELEIAELVAQGLSNREISIKLGISYEGVKQALKRIFRKLEVSARAQMVAKLKG